MPEKSGAACPGAGAANAANAAAINKFRLNFIAASQLRTSRCYTDSVRARKHESAYAFTVMPAPGSAQGAAPRINSGGHPAAARRRGKRLFCVADASALDPRRRGDDNLI